MNYERENIKGMSGYIPGEQLDGSEIIKLNTNENPYPPTPEITKVLANLDITRLRQYPSPASTELRQVIAELHNLHENNVVITNGGDELLRLVITTFVNPGETIGMAEPSYSLYPVLASIHDCKVEKIELLDDWSMSKDMAQLFNACNTKLCFLVNPHAPSGMLTKASALENFVEEFNGIVVIDEAYVDFVDPALEYDCIKLINRFNNVIILRTFSKGYSLAGLRMGYGLGSNQLIDPVLWKTRDSYNIDLIAQKIAHAAILDQDYAKSTWSRVREQRNYMLNELQKLGFTIPESQANFLLAKVPEGNDAADLYQSLKAQNILVRYFSQPRLEDKLRITIGSEEENQKLLAAISKLIV